MAEIRFTSDASLHRDYSGENFVHEIVGKISVRNTDDATEETAGELRTWLIQFIEAQDHGISSRVLGVGYSLELSRYWQELFDFDEFKAEIQKAWQTEGSDLLVVRSIQILDRFQGHARFLFFLCEQQLDHKKSDGSLEEACRPSRQADRLLHARRIQQDIGGHPTNTNMAAAMIAASVRTGCGLWFCSCAGAISRSKTL